MALKLAISMGFWGSAKRSSARSFSGLNTMIGTPRRAHSCSVPIMRGWLVPGLWPIAMIRSQWSKSSSETVPLPMPIDFGSPTLVASWHMLEQSGKLLVPNSRAKMLNRNAASFEARPEV